jgi:cytochrome P450
MTVLDPAAYSSENNFVLDGGTETAALPAVPITMLDPPAHTALRARLRRWFTPAKLRKEEPRVRGIITRLTIRDVDVSGTLVPAGTRVRLSFASANRDKRHYPDPDRFDLRRNPVDHLGFGYGVHGCAGQGLARIEAQALIGSLLRRAEHLELTGELVRHRHPVIRGLEHLPVSVVPAGEA